MDNSLARAAHAEPLLRQLHPSSSHQALQQVHRWLGLETRLRHSSFWRALPRRGPVHIPDPR
ncbi:DUF6193 family natural product biosynthesis protein [Streptomyces sp. NPDC058305]|uniref:DUF6193 family natural product biosynthesis protein n=1 Tax=Streptomyces sp. NPDC058305 TaxID=3346438 RepID=UPI0036EAF6F9